MGARPSVLVQSCVGANGPLAAGALQSFRNQEQGIPRFFAVSSAELPEERVELAEEMATRLAEVVGAQAAGRIQDMSFPTICAAFSGLVGLAGLCARSTYQNVCVCAEQGRPIEGWY